MVKARRAATDLNGVLLVDKPAGLTSHDVVNSLRSYTGEGRIGHAGTLDPAATGLLIVCIGPAAKLSERLMGLQKTYLARLTFGSATDTDDAEGQVIATAALSAELSDEQYARRVLADFSGSLLQTPPQFSAIKQQGKTAYSLARRGQTVELAARQVFIHSIELLSASSDSWDITARVSKGTYIRALARDIGQHTGCLAHLTGLRRLRIGPFSLAQAQTLPQLADKARSGNISSCFVQIPDLLGEENE